MLQMGLSARKLQLFFRLLKTKLYMKSYVFPGQGAQFPGMGKALYDSDSRAKKMFGKANEILGFDISKIMFEGTADELKATKVTQPAVFFTFGNPFKLHSRLQA
jgi:acyl transferase domain-containing protein